jgi:glycosyl transferase family 25
MSNFDFVEKIVYINLAHRTDRKEAVLKELASVGIPDSKVLRFDAIKHDDGAIGCTMSHIAVLKLAIENGWHNYLVVEDDAQWKDFQRGYNSLLTLHPENDVVILGGTFSRFSGSKLVHCQTTTGYVVKKEYYGTLLANFEEGLLRLQETGIRLEYAIDVYWNHLIKHDKWALILPAMIIQRPGYSDITKCHQNYSKWFS